MSVELMQKLEQTKTRLKAASGVLMARSEPANILHMLQYSVLALRCEFTVFMAMSAEKKAVEPDEFFRRLISQMMFEVKVLEESLGVMIDENGRVSNLTIQRPGVIGPDGRPL